MLPYLYLRAAATKTTWFSAAPTCIRETAVLDESVWPSLQCGYICCDYHFSDDKAHEPGEAMISKKSLRAVLVAFAIAFAMFAGACGSKTQPAPSQPAGTTTQPAKTSAAPGAPPGPRGTPGPTATRPPGNSPSTSGTGAPPSPSSPTSSPPVANVPGEGLPDCGQVPAGQPCYGPTPPPPVANVPGEGLPDCGQVPAGEPCYTPPRG